MFKEPILLNDSLVKAEMGARYPDDLRRRGVGGTVELRLRVREDGAPDAVEVFQGSGKAALDAVALELGARMRFQPAKVNGRPVRVWVFVPVVFTTRR